MKKTDEDTEENIRQLIEDGEPLGAIMKATNRSRSLVYKIARKHNLELAREGPTKGIPDPFIESPGETYKQTRSLVRKRSEDITQDIMKLGVSGYDTWHKIARSEGKDVNQFVTDCVDFYLENHELTPIWKRRIHDTNITLQQQDSLIKHLLDGNRFIDKLLLKAVESGHHLSFEQSEVYLKVYLQLMNHIKEESDVRNIYKSRPGSATTPQSVGRNDGAHNTGGLGEVEPPGTDVQENGVAEIAAPIPATSREPDGEHGEHGGIHAEDDEFQDDVLDVPEREQQGEQRGKGAKGAGKKPHDGQERGTTGTEVSNTRNHNGTGPTDVAESTSGE